LSGWIYSKKLEATYKGDTSVTPVNVNDYSEGDMVRIAKEFPDITCHYCKSIDELVGSIVMWALVYSIDESGELQVYIVFRGTQTALDAVIDASAVPIPVPFTSPGITTSTQDGTNVNLYSGIYIAMRSEFNDIIFELNNLLTSPILSGKWKTLKLYTTGHSLGGGYAQAFGVELVLNKSRIVFDGRSIKEVSAEEMYMQDSDDQLLSIDDGEILFTVVSFASPPMNWINMNRGQVDDLKKN